MKNAKLTKEEKDILKTFEQGAFKRVSSYRKKAAEYKKYAKATLAKSKSVKVPLSEKDLQKIKAKAIEEGIPYQIFLSSLIHKYIKKSVK